MASDLIFFWSDRLHSSQPGIVLSASSAQGGYAVDSVREADLQTAWKPADSPSTDEWIKADLGSVGTMGSAASTAYFAVAYDARGSNQDILTLQTHSLDDGTFVGGTLENVFTPHTIVKNGVVCWYTTFAVHNPARRYYRLIQKGADRSGGSVTAKILSWAMFQGTDVMPLSVAYPGHSEGAWTLDPVYNTSRFKGAGGRVIGNKFAAPGYSFQINIRPASDALFKTIRDSFDAIAGMNRAIYVQKEGLPNAVLGNFWMCLLSDKWQSDRKYNNQSNMSIPMETVVWQ